MEVTSARVFSGKTFLPLQHLLLYSADEWEEFLKEWAHYKKQQYYLVTRLGGAGDNGVDVAAFQTDKYFDGAWDNYQCKHYGKSLMPSTAIPEIGKLLWNVHAGNLSLPRHYYFFAPRDCGLKLKKLLLKPADLKAYLFDEWDKICAGSITSTTTIRLENEFREFVDTVDFQLFRYMPVESVIEEHRQTPYHRPRFGGQLDDRPPAAEPTSVPSENEARYLEQLYEAYSDKEERTISPDNIDSTAHVGHLKRQREAFYYAESLETFARDSVPPGTFQALQDELYAGVVEVSESAHTNGLERVNEVLKAATSLNLTANGLIQVTKTQDRKGICHQLANENKLVWVPDD